MQVDLYRKVSVPYTSRNAHILAVTGDCLSMKDIIVSGSTDGSFALWDLRCFKSTLAPSDTLTIATVLEAHTSSSVKTRGRRSKSQERLLDGETLLNQREDYILSRIQEISRLQKELQASRLNLEEESKALKDEKYNLELKAASLDARDEEVVRKENDLKKKFKELSKQHEEIANKESVRIKQTLAKHEAVLKEKSSQFDTELETKLKLMEDKIQSKRWAAELREVELSQREDIISERLW